MPSIGPAPHRDPTHPPRSALPEPIVPPRDPAARPSFSDARSSFLPPGHQALRYVEGLLKEEKGLRDLHDLGSPEWFRHHRNVELFESYPDYLKGFPDFDPRKEKRELRDIKARNATHNRAAQARKEATQREIERATERLMGLVELRWAAENHGKIIGKPVWGRMDSVPGLDLGEDRAWYARKAPKAIDIRGKTAEGVDREIAAVQAELQRLDARKEALACSERTTPLYPLLEFRGREAILERGFEPPGGPGASSAASA